MQLILTSKWRAPLCVHTYLSTFLSISSSLTSIPCFALESCFFLPQISACNLCSILLPLYSCCICSFACLHCDWSQQADWATAVFSFSAAPSHTAGAIQECCTAPWSPVPCSPAGFVSVLVCTSNNITLWTAFSLVLHRNSSSLSFLFLVFPPPSLPLVWHSPLPVVQQLRRIYARDFHTFTINNSWIYCTLIPAAFVILI